MSETEQIRFIIESGFRGAFVVERDPGAPPVAKDSSGAWVYRIPATGSLKTSEIGPFQEWHDIKAAYTDGTLLGFSGSGPIKPYSDGSIKVRPLSSDSQGRFYFLVGTELDLNRAMHNLTKLKLGRVEGSPVVLKATEGAVATFTLGSSWVDQYLSGLALLRALLGQPDNLATARPETPEAILPTLQEIALGRYRPGPVSTGGGWRAAAFRLQPPALVPSTSYRVLFLNAATGPLGAGSVEAGIIFEDPAWAVLAAHAVGVPLASDNNDLWSRLGRMQAAINTGKYSAYDFFGGISGFLPQASPRAKPQFRLMQVASEQLMGLRALGVQSFGDRMGFYKLFQPPLGARKAKQ